MICPNKFAKEVARASGRKMPNVSDELIKNGFDSVKSGDEIKQINTQKFSSNKVENSNLNALNNSNNEILRMATKAGEYEKVFQKEARGIHNVMNNGKKSTLIKRDLDSIDSAIKFERGFNNKNNKGYGAKHIIKHTINKDAKGYITNIELVNLGKNIREYIKNHKEPFIDKNGARIYEWENSDGVRFRAVVGDIQGKAPTTAVGSESGLALRERIITFYSDRNLNEPMKFKNPNLNQLEPIKEFGVNYAEFYHDGKNAIRKLLAERQGQVAGAFEREELGDIDLVWGEVTDAIKHKGYGLAHILDKRTAEFIEQGFSKEQAQNKAIDFVKNIDEIIKNGNVLRDDKGRIRIESDKFIIGIKDNYYGVKSNNWIVTGYIKKENAESLYASSAITKGETLPLNSSGNSTTTANKSQAETIAKPKWADKFKAKMTKMGQEYSDEKIANLANWHKDSHAATKEKDGSPKVFYHGTNANFDTFDINKLKGSWLGKSFYFTDTKQKAKGYGKNVMSIYLNIKNPYISKANDNYDFVREVKEQFNVKENFGEFDPAQVLKEHGYDGVVYKDWDDEVGTIYTAFSPNQIKSISNNGAFNPNSNMIGGFSTMAMQKAILHLGSGFAGGTINANAEQDPDKKAEAFVKGFLLGAGGSVAAIKTLESSAKLAPQLARISQGIAKDLPGILNDRPDIVGKALGKSPKDNYNYIFGGENAIGANKAKLQTARDMAKNGADESEIWAKTGWYKDIDGKWKFEINPKGGKFKKVIKDLFDAKAFKEKNKEKLEVLQDRAKINDKYQANLNNLNATLSQQASIITKAKDGLNLSEVLDDKKLFNAYPQLRDIKVRFDELEGQMSIYDGYYDRTLDEIVLNSKLYNKPEMLRSILYHEIQHKIQRIEGFARGGMGKDGLEYRRLAGEVEARNEQTRLIPSELNNAKLERTTDLDDLEKIAKALPKSQTNEQISKELIALKKQDMALDNEYGKISPQRDKEIDRLTDELDNRFNALVGQIDKDELATALLKVYNKTKHPNATADVIPELRKVVFNDSDVSASYTPKQSIKEAEKIEILPNLSFKEAQAEVYNTLKRSIGSDIKNIDSGVVAQINEKGAKKIVSNQAIKKSISNGFSAKEHLSTAVKTPQLFTEAIFWGRFNDIKNNQDSVKILRFAKNININGKNAVAIITAKESLDKDLRRIYSVELDELRKAGLKSSNHDKTKIPANSLISQDNGVVDSVAPIKESLNSTTTANESQAELENILKGAEGKEYPNTIAGRWEKRVDEAFSWAYKNIYAKGVRSGIKGASKITTFFGGDGDMVSRGLEKTFALQDEIGALSRLKSAYQRNNQVARAEAMKVYENLVKLKIEERVALFRMLDGQEVEANLSQKLRPIYEKLRDKIDERAEQLISLGALKGENAKENYIKYSYSQYYGKKDGSLGAFGIGKLRGRNENLSYEDRVKMGLIEDAAVAVTQTLNSQNNQIQKAILFKNLADEYGVDQPKDGYVKVSDESVGGGIKKYGALAGKYVPSAVYDDLQNAGIISSIFDTIRPYTNVIDHIKVNLTVKNPATHGYNVLSNSVLAFLHGDLGANLKLIKLLATDKKGFDELLAKADAMGLNSANDDIEMRNLLMANDEVAKEAAKSQNPLGYYIAKAWQNIYLTKNSTTGKVARSAYAWEDKWFKLARFKKNLDMGMSDEAAFNDANSAYVDYSSHFNPALKVLDKTGVLPFFHFAVKSSIVVTKAAIKNPAKFAMLQTALIGSGASALPYWFDSEQKDADNSRLPDWASSNYLPNLFGVKNQVQIGESGLYFNAARAMAGFRLSSIDDITGGGGLIGGLLDILRGRDSWGNDMVSKHDPAIKQLTARLDAFSKQFLPSITLGRYGRQGLAIATGNNPKNAYDEPMGLGELAGRFMGLRMINEKKELRSAAINAKNRYKKAKEKGDEGAMVVALNDFMACKAAASDMGVSLEALMKMRSKDIK